MNVTHRARWRRGLSGICCFVLALSVGCARSEALAITPDGRVDDWAAATALHTDSSGDQGTSDIDLGRLWAANDAALLHLRFEIGAEQGIQADNDLTLYLDTDNSAATGLSVGGIGAEVRWTFGARSGASYNPDGSEQSTLSWLDLDLRQGPTVTADEFEVTLSRAGFGATVALLLQNEEGGVQDRLPNAGQTLTYTFDATTVPPPATLSLAKSDPAHVRVVSHNVLWDGLFDRPDPFGRILPALGPDIICFQEIGSHTAEETAAQVTAFLGGTWFAAQQNDVVTVTPWPITATHAIDNNLGTLIDLPDTDYATDLYLINVHLPCCSNDAGRQSEVDAIIAWVRDLQTPGGTATLATDTPIAVTGDMNFVGLAQQVDTLLTGDIQDEATHGTDHAPDWDGSAATDLFPRHTNRRDVSTWRNDGGSFAPGRLDYMVFTDSVVEVGNHFLLWTPTMTAAELSAAGLEADDTAVAADHLPVVVDFEIAPATPTGTVIRGTP